MSYIINQTKPQLSSLPLLCDFRTSKAYLWGLIRDKLNTIVANSPSSTLNVFDAACHALITRNMFNSKLNYYGIDISRTRLLKAFSIKRSSDCLFYGDLTKPLGLDNCFDIVVSCNTLSHLPFEQQILALKQLIQCCKHDSHLIFNCGVDSNLFLISQVLMDCFDVIEPVYFNSHLSFDAESKNMINASNVHQFLHAYESSLPNEAIFHKGVIFHCRKRVDLGNSKANILSNFNSSKIIQLNHVPDTKLIKYPTDSHFLQSFSAQSSQSSSVFLSSKLYSSECGAEIYSYLKKLSVPCFALDESCHDKTVGQFIYLLGLENEWSRDLAKDRTYVNILREIPGVSVRFVHVSKRSDIPSTPSLLLSDF